MIKAIIFDCFGVVVGRGIWSIYEMAGGDLVKDAEHLDDILYLSNAGKMSDDDFHVAITSRLEIGVKEWKELTAREELPNTDILEYIRDELKPRFKIGFISNVSSGVIDRKLPKEWQALFDDMIISADVGLVKPDPEIFRLAAKNLGVKPEESVFTDDREEYLPGANHIGMKTILYKDFNDFKIKLEKLL